MFTGEVYADSFAGACFMNTVYKLFACAFSKNTYANFKNSFVKIESLFFVYACRSGKICYILVARNEGLCFRRAIAAPAGHSRNYLYKRSKYAADIQ